MKEGSDGEHVSADILILKRRLPCASLFFVDNNGILMKLLYAYLRRYWKLVVLALFLAAVNQVFSLLDPLIFRHIIDE